MTHLRLGHHGRLIEEWQAIESAALDTVIAMGGTVDRQRPPLFAAALKAAKRVVDPEGFAQSRSPDRSLRRRSQLLTGANLHWSKSAFVDLHRTSNEQNAN